MPTLPLFLDKKISKIRKNLKSSDTDCTCCPVTKSCQTVILHELQLTRPPCPSPTPEACSNSCPSSRWCHPSISSSVVPFSCPSSCPSIRVFSNESAVCIRCPKHWSFSFSISPSSDYLELISLRMDWLDLLAVQETLKSLLQHTVWKHQVFGAQPCLWSNSHICTWLLENP